MAMVQRVLSIAAAAWGCSCSEPGGPPGDGPDGPGNDGHDQIVAPLAGMESQSPFLLGEGFDNIGQEPGYHANVTTDAVARDGTPLTIRFDGSASLIAGSHRGADRFFDGVVFAASAGGQVRLTVTRGGTDLAFYKVEARADPSQPFVDVCNGGDAVPLAGRWQRTGFHEYTRNRLSFACTGSVAYKCTVWGYLAGSDPDSLAWRAHQACTRMARGDYCANGRSHTRDGTKIRIYDFAGVTQPPPQRFTGVQDWPPNVNRMFFEAAWSDGGHPAVCLSRIRWQSLPILGAACDTGELRDPRLASGVGFCEDLEWPEPGAEPAGALLFNESLYTDLALHVWEHEGDLVSTVRGLYDPPAIRPPFVGRGDYAHRRPDGLVLRVLRPDVGAADVQEIRLYGKPGDLVVASASDPPAGYNDLGFEGFVRVQPFPGSKPLNLYRHTTSGDLFSTVSETPPAGYALVSLIGHVLPPEPN